MKEKVTLLARMFFFTLVLSITISVTGQNTYYVNALTGDDSRTPTEAQNSETPWKTLSHAIPNSSGSNPVVHVVGTLTEDVDGEPGNPGGGIVVDKEITIEGDGPGSTIIQANALAGNATNRVFYVSEGMFPVMANIRNLTIRHGNPGADGGGIYNNATLSLNNVSIENNNAYAGAGILSVSGITMNNVTVKNNSADSCAGVLIKADAINIFQPSITQCEISNNKASKGPGGGIGFISTGMGGSINRASISQCEIKGNSANVSMGIDTLKGGGGIFLYASTDATLETTFEQCNIESNSTNGFGGGIISKILSQFGGSSVEFTDCAILNNSAGKSGGGSASYGSITIDQCTFSGNSAKGHGGGIANTGNLSISFSTVANNTCDFNDDDYGDGGGFANYNNLTIEHTLIADNKDGSSGGNNYPGIAAIDGTITSNGYNLLENNNGAATDFSEGNPNSNNDYVGTESAPIDALIEALADNGGKTKTHALQSSSPAIDAGDTTANPDSDYDQRGSGFPRIQDGDELDTATIDIGAFEYPDPNSPELTTDSAVVTADSVVLYGTVIPKGKKVTNIQFYYYFYGQFGNKIEGTVTATPDSVESDENVSVMATLFPFGGAGTTYYYSLDGDHNDVTLSGEEKSFVTFIDLSNVDINIRESRLTNTSNQMEYQINGGEWKPCSNMNTQNVVFEPGDVIVRQKNAPENSRVVYSIDPPADAPEFTINYANEETAEIIADTIQYSNDNFDSDINLGDNINPVSLDVPDYGQDDGHIYFRVRAMRYTLPSNVQDMVIPARPSAPIVSLSDKSSTTAVFVKSSTGKGDTVATSDGYEYTLDDGGSYSDILDGTTVDASGDLNIKARAKATSSAFASMLTGNLDGPLDLTPVDINVADNLLTNTLAAMEYSLNSTDGTDGDWYACSDNSTTVTFVEGDVYVREAADVSNYRLVANVIKQATPSYTINYPDETTDETVPSTDEYSLDNFATAGTDGTGEVVALNVPDAGAADGHIYFRTKATQTQLASDIFDLTIPARPDAPTYAINYENETTTETVPSTDEYSLDNFASAGSPGNGNALNLTIIPEYGESSEYVYFRTMATASSFLSAIQALEIPARPAPPVVSLSDQSSANAVFVKSATGTGDTVTTADVYEYSLDDGSTWTDITDGTTVDATGEKNIIVREQATSTTFASSSTSNLDGDLNLTNVGVNVAQNIITNTLSTMEYSLNSADGTDGDWYACSDGNTSVTFTEGDVYVREAANTSNNRLVANITKASTPSYTIDYMNETTEEAVPSTDEYSLDNFATAGTDGSGSVVDLTVPAPGASDGHIYFRTKATASLLASDIQDLVIPARPDAPSYTIDYTNETTAEVVPSTDQYSLDNFATAGTNGPGTVIDLTVPDAGTADGHIYFRTKATASTFLSAIQDLTIPARPNAPVVSLDDNSSASAVFMKSADGSAPQVGTSDGYEYTTDEGTTWTDITDATTVDATGDKDIRVRIGATGTAFASAATGNLDGALDLTPVTVNVAQGTLNSTLTTMEYSMNSTDGTDGDWSACNNNSTSVTFFEGDVYVREAANPSNYRLVANITRVATPSYSINYVDETTTETVPSTDEYSLDNFATAGTDGSGAVVDLTVPAQGEADGHIYFRSKATQTQLESEIQDLVITARPAAPSYTINYPDETTNEVVPATDEYSEDNFATAGHQGPETVVDLSVPDYGQSDNAMYFRTKATASSFVSAVQTLAIPARPANPVVSLSDQNSATATFMKSADGSAPQVTTSDGYEYTTDDGTTWTDITDATTVDATGDKNIKVRQKATATTFASSTTYNLDGSVDLSVVTVNVAAGVLNNTLVIMQYSLNSTDGSDGDWTTCNNTTTPVEFLEGDVYIREINDPSNFRLLISVTKPAAPSFTIDFMNETTEEAIPATQEYSSDNFATDVNDGTGEVVNLTVPEPGTGSGTLWVRVKATSTTLASEAQELTIPERPAAPVVSLSDIDASDATFKKSADGTGEDVTEADGYEYSADGGSTWSDITASTTVDATGDKDIRARAKATASRFLSVMTEDLDSIGTSIVDQPSLAEIHLYPNPAREKINIMNANKSSVFMFNANGAMVKQINVTSDKSAIDISELSGGAYIVNIFIDNQVITKKIIIMQ